MYFKSSTLIANVLWLTGPSGFLKKGRHLRLQLTLIFCKKQRYDMPFFKDRISTTQRTDLSHAPKQ